MANKTDSVLNKSDFQNQLKVYYDGKSPEESGSSVIETNCLDSKHRPWLFKYYVKDGVCYQFIDAIGAYHKVSAGISQVLDAIIVNTKQRAAIDKIVDNVLWEALGRDLAGEKDSIEDPCEY